VAVAVVVAVAVAAVVVVVTVVWVGVAVEDSADVDVLVGPVVPVEGAGPGSVSAEAGVREGTDRDAEPDGRLGRPLPQPVSTKPANTSTASPAPILLRAVGPPLDPIT
jgi:hypothetical protein